MTPDKVPFGGLPCDKFGLHSNIVSIIAQFSPEQTNELFMSERAQDDGREACGHESAFGYQAIITCDLVAGCR